MAGMAGAGALQLQGDRTSGQDIRTQVKGGGFVCQG